MDCFPLLYKLEQWYEIYFRQIYGGEIKFFENSSLPSIYTYYQSWLLRGNNPNFNQNNKKYTDLSILDYDRYALNEFSDEIISARENNDACKLFELYHFDVDAKSNGSISEQWKVDELYQSAIHEIQNRMCKDIEKRHISIETNPTSNYRIGSLERYTAHPIKRFFNHGINTDYPPSQISVSINTDDLGIFSTSIEREFSLVVLALEKDMENRPRTIYDWIDRIRNMAFEQRFYHN